MQCMQATVTGCTWEYATISGRPEFLLSFGIHVAQDDASLWTREGFVGTAGHPGRPLVQRRLKLPSCHQPQNMRTVIEQGNVFCFTERGNLRDRFGEKEKTFTHDDKLRRK